MKSCKDFSIFSPENDIKGPRSHPFLNRQLTFGPSTITQSSDGMFRILSRNSTTYFVNQNIQNSKRSYFKTARAALFAILHKTGGKLSQLTKKM
jgi:hypothetical protein